MESQAMEWIAITDRGGLTRIDKDTYQLFYTTDMCMRSYFHTNDVTKYG